MLVKSAFFCALSLVSLIRSAFGVPQGSLSHPNAPIEKYPWAALGDSYAAGPGAGKHYDKNDPEGCYRNDGAYAPSVQSHWVPGGQYGESDLRFLACSGAKTLQVIDKQIPEMDRDVQAVTLSIGGNDLGFARILKACIIKPFRESDQKCEDALSRARKIIAEELEGKLVKTWDAIFDKMSNKEERKVFQTLYGKFFNANSVWCNKQYMGLSGAYLTKELRERMNALAIVANDKIISSMVGYVQRKLEDPHGWTRNRLAYLNPDQKVYEGSRFCEPGIESLDDKRISFFKLLGKDNKPSKMALFIAGIDPSTCTQDPRYDDDDIFLWKCDAAWYKNKNPDAQGFLPDMEDILKAFHPKSVPFGILADGVNYGISVFGFPREQSVKKGGSVQCHTRFQGDDHWFSHETALKAIDEFCSKGSKSNGGENSLQTATSTHHGLLLSFNPTLDGCKSEDGPPLIGDGPDAFKKACMANFRTALEDCDTVKGDRGDRSKQGGFYHHPKCFTFSIAKAPTRPITKESMDAWNWEGFHW